MPLALLLHEVSRELSKGANMLVPFQRLVVAEEILLGRAKSAFVVHWFGSGLPLAGSGLRVAIDNLDALRARHQAVRAAAASRDRGFGPNLTEPLAGMAGMLVGSLSAPVHSMVTYAIADRALRRWYATLAASLNVLTWGALGAVIAALLGLGVAVALPASFNDATGRAVFDLLGALARLAAPMVRFWEIVSGPRAAVPNPLWREALLLLDRLAVLAPFVLALFAVLVTRVGPLLRPLATQIPLLLALVRETVEVILLVVSDFLDRLAALMAPERSPFTLLQVTLRALTRLWPTLKRGLSRLLAPLSEALGHMSLRLAAALGGWWRRILPFIRRQTVNHPLVRLVRSFIDAVKVAARVLTSLPSSLGPPGAFSLLASAVGRRALGEVRRALGPEPPEPAFPTLPDEAAREAAGGPPAPWRQIGELIELGREMRRAIPGFGVDPFALDRRAAAGLARARRPPSFFAAEHRALERRLGLPPEQALALRREEQLALRGALLSVAGRVLPPAAAVRVQRLAPLLETLDEVIHASPEARQRLPVRLLPADDTLRPVVRRLRLRATGVEEGDARRWLAGLRQALTAEAVVVGAAP